MKQAFKNKQCAEPSPVGSGIPEGWSVTALKDIAVVNEKTIDKKYPHSEIEYIDIASVDKGRVLEIRKLFRSEAPSRAQRIVRDNDILLSTVRPNLKHFAFMKTANSNMIASTGFAVISSKTVDARFLYYYLTTNKYTDYLSAIADAHTSTYPAFNPDILENSEIPFPPENEQRAIAKILSDLDDKIELNHQMNKTLESIAQALFKRWFVDFEFPGREKTKFIDDLPEEWRVGKLGEIIDNFDFKRVPLSSRQRDHRKGAYPYYGATSVVDYVDDYIFDGIYVLMGEDGTVITDEGYPVLQYVWDKFWVNNHAHVIRGKEGISTEYILLQLQQTNVGHIVTGAVQPKINQGNMNNLPVIIPSQKIMAIFDEVINPIYYMFRRNTEEMKNLSQIRDSLLPRLMSGKIRVKL